MRWSGTILYCCVQNCYFSVSANRKFNFFVEFGCLLSLYLHTFYLYTFPLLLWFLHRGFLGCLCIIVHCFYIPVFFLQVSCSSHLYFYKLYSKYLTFLWPAMHFLFPIFYYYWSFLFFIKLRSYVFFNDFVCKFGYFQTFATSILALIIKVSGDSSATFWNTYLTSKQRIRFRDCRHWSV